MYGVDKLLALNNKQRIRERTLHVISCFGGWPGGYLGQRLFKHKISKRKFIKIFWFTVFINILALITFLKFH